jgi:hypothetical protein
MHHTPETTLSPRRRTAAVALAMAAVLCFFACDGDDPQLKPFGACCQADTECESNICHPSHISCTVLCQEDSQCPPEPKSGEPSCAVKEGDPRKLCQAESDGDLCANR